MVLRLGCFVSSMVVQRNKIIKVMKRHIGKIAHDQRGSMVFLCIVSTVDDTKLIKRIVSRELQMILKELVMDKSGILVPLQLLHPNCSHYLTPDDLASLNLSIPSLCTKDGSQVNSEMKSLKDDESSEEMADQEVVPMDESTSPAETLNLVEGGKKDPHLRKRELLVSSGLAEVAIGGSDDILCPTLDNKLNTLHEAISALTLESKSEASEEEHILENFHASCTMRKLVLECPTFTSTLWKKALKGKCELCAHGHSCKVVSAFLESSESKVHELAKKELQPLIDNGSLKITEAKQAKQPTNERLSCFI